MWTTAVTCFTWAYASVTHEGISGCVVARIQSPRLSRVGISPRTGCRLMPESRRSGTAGFIPTWNLIDASSSLLEPARRRADRPTPRPCSPPRIAGTTFRKQRSDRNAGLPAGPLSLEKISPKDRSNRHRRPGGLPASSPRYSTPSACCAVMEPPVHLRSRGEHAQRCAKSILGRGSPPLTRRAPVDLPDDGRVLRFTSARAESTRRAAARGGRGPVHLLSRGEHHTGRLLPPDKIGSPPLARRARGAQQHVVGVDRFTSARAESTVPFTSCSSCAAVHLRSRGEHLAHACVAPVRDGSPPLARRAPQLLHRPVLERRFTSAHAEST